MEPSATTLAGGAGGIAGGAARPISAGRVHLQALDGCRALAALGVLVTHVALLSGYAARNEVVGPYLARMDVGVSIFFVLSGFLLYRPFVAARLRGDHPGDLGAYARRRVLRIVPAYWVALTIVAFVLRAPGFEEPHSVVSHYLLLHVYDSTQLVGGPIQQAWSLATEVAFYTFVPIWAWVMSRRQRPPERQVRVEVVALVVLFVASLLANLVLIGIDTSQSRFAQLGTWLPFRIGDFVPGMLLAVLTAHWSQRGAHLPRWVTGAPLTSGCWAAGAVVFWFVSTQLDLPMFPTFSPEQALGVRLIYTTFATLLVVPAVLARQDRGPVRAVFANPVAVWLGLVSYGIYIWHEAWQDMFLRWTGQASLAASFRDMLLVTVALSLACAAASWYLVERPVMRWAVRPRPLERWTAQLRSSSHSGVGGSSATTSNPGSPTGSSSPPGMSSSASSSR